jgi:protein-disulfide isomerase
MTTTTIDESRESIQTAESAPEIIPSEPPPPTTAPVRGPSDRAGRAYSVGLVVAFALGAVSGGSGHSAYMAHGTEVRDWYADLVESRRGPWDDATASIPVSSDDPTWGNRDALVTIVQFSDFQCPFCSRVEDTMKKIRDAYGPDSVRIVWKNAPLPFHPNAKPAAEAARGVFALAGRRAFWKFHDLAFKNQQQLSADSYEAWAKEAGLGPKDLAKLKDGLAAHTWAAKVEADTELGTKSGVKGTPAAFVNGVLVSGAQPFDAFKKVIDEQIGKAKAKVAAGTPRASVYAELSQENAKSAPAAKEEDSDPAADTTTVYKVPIAGAPALGLATAPVTIVAFSDYQCPFCKRAEDTLKQVRDAYGDKVRIVWRDAPLPFHPHALPAAKLAREARAEKGDAAFWQAHDAIFASAPQLEEADLGKIGQDLKLDPKKVAAALAGDSFAKGFAEDKSLGESLQVNGTPAFFINGRRLVGAQPIDQFKKVIDEELKKAAALKAQGVTDVYAAITKDGKQPGGK